MRDRRWTWSWVAGGYIAALLVGILFAQVVRGTGHWDQGLDWEREFLLLNVCFKVNPRRPENRSS